MQVEEIPIKKQVPIIKGTAPKNGYIEAFVIDKSQVMPQLSFESADIDIMPLPKPSLGGSIANDLQLMTYGECLAGVCVKSSIFHGYYDYRSDGSTWYVTCLTTFEDCDDPGTPYCDDGIMITPPPTPVDNPWTEQVQVPDGCGTCLQDIIHHSDGTDTYSGLYGCDYSGCSEVNPNSGIDNNLTDPCLKNQMSNIENLSPFSPIGEKLNPFIYGNVNLEFDQSINPPIGKEGADAGTTPVFLDANGLPKIITTFYRYTLDYASKEYVTAVMLHEILHAYILSSYPPPATPPSQLDQHIEIAQNYINDIISALHSIFPSLDSTTLAALALGGMGDIAESNPALWNNICNQYGVTPAIVKDANKKYQNRDLGTICN